MFAVGPYCSIDTKQSPIIHFPLLAQHDFHGASLVLENGQEIPITEEMIQASLEEIIQQEEFV